jgi:hypothetical protein
VAPHARSLADTRLRGDGAADPGAAGHPVWPKPERKTPVYRYEDSNRYYRGRVLAVLRRISRSNGGVITLRELGRQVKPDFDERDPYWLYAAVESLCKDGLAKVTTGPEATNTPDSVAEEPAAYGAWLKESQSLALDQMISLP